MATENKINILISAVDEASRVLSKVGGSITDFAKRNEKAFEGMRNVGAVAFGAITAQAFSSISAFKESETQMVRVDQILKNMDYKGLKVSMEQAGQEARTFGDSLQNLSGIGGEQASESFAKLFQITKDVTQATKLATLAADLSVAKSIDMDSATKLVSMALAGNTKAMKEYGIELDDSATPLQNLEELQKRVGGQAEAFGKTLEGQQKILSESFGDMQESIGGALAPALSQLLGSIQPVISSIVKWAGENPELVKNIILVSGAIAGFITVLGVLGIAIPAIVAGLGLISWPIIAIIAGVTALGFAWNSNFMGIQEKTGEVIAFVIANFLLLQEKAYKIFDEIKAFWEIWGESIKKGFSNVWETLKSYTVVAFGIISIAFTEGFAILGGVFDIYKGAFTGNWSLMWEGIKTVLGSAWRAMKGIITLVATEINEWIKTVFGIDIGATVSSIFTSVYNTVKNSMDGMFNYVVEKFNAIIQKIRDASTAIYNANPLKGVGESIGSKAYDLFNGPKFATGGYFSGNGPIMVGERGPEIIMPTGSGRVIPNNQMGGGQSVNISFGNVTISNGMELDDLTNKIKSVLYNEHKQARLGY